jgi:hypothetical protein
MLEYKPDEQHIINFKCALEQYLQFVDTFRILPGGSETVLFDLNLQHMLTIMARFSNNLLFSAKTNYVSASMFLASTANPEHCLHIKGSGSLPSALVVVGSEAKGLEASMRMCYPQLIAVSGSSAIEMHRLGLAREDCVVPGIAMAGACVQFCAVYLLEHNFPVFVALSPELSPFGSYEEQHAVAEWCLRLVEFARVTAERLSSRRQVKPLASELRLNMTGYFAKPVRRGWKQQHDIAEAKAGADADAGARAGDVGYDATCTRFVSIKNIRLNQIMRMYEKMRLVLKQQHAEFGKVILFPEGVVAVPGADVTESEALRKMLIDLCVRDGFGGVDLRNCPLILFPRLSAREGWGTGKPSPSQRGQYLEQLFIAITVLNASQIAHLDLRPANIMWRERRDYSAGGEVGGECSQIELFLIDFEDAVLFNHIIPSEFVDAVVRSGDMRYPFKRGDEKEMQLAREFHNTFFFEAVSQWTSSDVSDFTGFMMMEGAKILALDTRV